MESDLIKEIKKRVIDRLYESYEDQLNEEYADKRKEIEQEYSAFSAVDHSFTEKEIDRRRTAYVDRRIKLLKKKNLRKAMEGVIHKCFGLKDKTWEWEKFSKEQIEEFLYVMVSLRFEDDRIIYYDKIETDRKIRNKFIFRDIEKCSLDIDFIKYCNYISEYSFYYMLSNEIMLENILEEKAYLLAIEQEGIYRPEPYILALIENWYKYYLLPEASGKSVLELYYVIASCEEIIGSLLIRYYTYNESEKIYDIEKKFLRSVEKEITELDFKEKLWKYHTEYDIFQEYVWRLMNQTTEKENDVRSEIYEILGKDLNGDITFDFVLDEDKCCRVKQLFAWYVDHNYSVYSFSELETADSKSVYYEIYIDKKTKYNGMTAETIMNKILRDEYYRGFQLSEEVLFLLYKIRRGILRNRGINYNKYFDLKSRFNKLSKLIWGMSKRDNYNPSVLFNLWYGVVAKWMKNN